jgi:hypothetical protein
MKADYPDQIIKNDGWNFIVSAFFYFPLKAKND